MSARPRVLYEGPRGFFGASLLDLRRELDRAFVAVSRAVRELAGGGARRWESSGETIRQSGGLGLVANRALVVDTSAGNTVQIAATPIDAADYGLEAGVIRLSTLGAIVLMPIAGATINGSTSSLTLAATVGFYTFQLTPRGYYIGVG